jgi:rod shape-determining protein MreB
MRLRPGLAIDLGTVNTLIYVAGRGLVVDEPSVIALERDSRQVMAVGKWAEVLFGREPEGVDVIWPLRDGVVADIDASVFMLNAFLRQARVHRVLRRPLAVLCVPKGATAWERQIVAATVAARSPHCAVRLIDEPVAASLGAGASGTSQAGVFVVDVGGGTTEIAVVIGTRVARARSLRVGGNAMDEAIINTVKSDFGVSLGRRTAEFLKTTLGLTGGDTGSADVFGVCGAGEGIRVVPVSGELVARALEPAVRAILSAVNEVLTEIPPDLAGDVAARSIQLAGGGALLLGLAERMANSTGVSTCVVEDPLRCVLRGAADVIENDEFLRSATAA